MIIGLLIYKCPRGIGEKLTDSFLEKDCNTFCWEGSHLIYVFISSLILVTFSSAIFYFRQVFSKASQSQTITISPIFTSFKSFLQIILLVLDFGFKDRFSLGFNSSYILIIGLYLIFLFKYPAFNYNRIKILSISSIGIVLWNSVLVTIFYIIFG